MSKITASSFQQVILFVKGLLLEKKVKYFLYTSFLLCFATLFRSYIFNLYGGFSNDDIFYMSMATNIWNKGMISLDGVNVHTTWPPGYPFALGLEKKIMGNYFEVIKFNYVYGTALLSFMAIQLGQVCGIRSRYLLATSCTISPIFLISIATLQISSNVS